MRPLRLPLRPRARTGLRPWLLAALTGLAAGACFNPPAAAVMFACDPAGSSACPAGYTCKDDGCCHKDGADDPADDGACKLGGGPGGTDATTTDATTTDATTGTTGTAGTTGTTGTTGDTSTGSSSSSSSTGPQTTGTT